MHFFREKSCIWWREKWYLVERQIVFYGEKKYIWWGKIRVVAGNFVICACQPRHLPRHISLEQDLPFIPKYLEHHIISIYPQLHLAPFPAYFFQHRKLLYTSPRPEISIPYPYPSKSTHGTRRNIHLRDGLFQETHYYSSCPTLIGIESGA